VGRLSTWKKVFYFFSAKGERAGTLIPFVKQRIWGVAGKVFASPWEGGNWCHGPRETMSLFTSRHKTGVVANGGVPSGVKQGESKAGA